MRFILYSEVRTYPATDVAAQAQALSAMKPRTAPCTNPSCCVMSAVTGMVNSMLPSPYRVTSAPSRLAKESFSMSARSSSSDIPPFAGDRAPGAADRRLRSSTLIARGSKTRSSRRRLCELCRYGAVPVAPPDFERAIQVAGPGQGALDLAARGLRYRPGLDEDDAVHRELEFRDDGLADARHDLGDVEPVPVRALDLLDHDERLRAGVRHGEGRSA